MPAEALSADSLTQHVKSIPTLPAVLTELSRRMEDPKTSTDDLAQIITQDQAIASKVLKLVNSPFYGYSGKIHTISQGIVILGFNAVKNLVLSTSVLESFKSAESGDFFSMNHLWIHSASVASVARMLADKRKNCDPEEAFVAGLLHDIGKVLLWVSEPKLFSAVLQASGMRNLPLMDVEKKVLGFTDDELGSILAEKWKFPESLKTTLRWQNHPGLAGSFQGLASCIHCADILVTACGAPALPQPVLDAPLPDIWKAMQLNEDDVLRGVVKEVPSRLAAAKTFVETAL